ncbi:hypothetical protein QTG54_001228 [Skeletonema marinoi]|uniref:Uncharacterized protein n=1 Tax=Skeletonema marinoi TaxID=267567 RepID=A0AAD8YMD1_9STRA|nr:hypothetical protein QTG54_001228 [Skeletonema marinoi]
MEAQRYNSVGGVVAAQAVKATDECGVGGTRKNQFPTQQPMMPPHYFPPHQYPPGHFPGYPMYPPMPYPHMYGYHQYPPRTHPHMNVNTMRQPYNAMPPAFAKPPNSVPQAIFSTKNDLKVEAKAGGRSAPADKPLDQKSSLSIKPTVSTETSRSASPSDTQPVVMKTKTEMMSNSQVSLQGSTSVETEPDTFVMKQPFKRSESDLETSGHVLKEKQNTVNEQEDVLPLTQQKKQEDLPSLLSPEKEEFIHKPREEIQVHPYADASTTSSNFAVPEKEKSEVNLDDLDNALVFHCADTDTKFREGVESLLLLSQVAEKLKPTEEDSNMGSIHSQQSGQEKPSKKRKLQLPMRTDRKEEGPLPKRIPEPPQRTPAFFHFLLHHKESIEEAIFSDEDTCYGVERSEQVAKEGALWWLATTDDEKQRWADVSTQKYLGLLS